MFKVFPKRCCHRAASHRQPALALHLVGQSQATSKRRSLLVFSRSRQLSLTIVAAANPTTVKTYSATLSATPGGQGRAVRLEGGMA